MNTTTFRSPRIGALSVRVLMFCVITLVAGSLPAGESRTWTSTSGSTTEAVLISCSDDHVVLKRGGENLRVPLAKLSLDDRHWVRAHETCCRRRVWTTADGFQCEGRYQSASDDNVIVQTTRGEKTFSFSELSEVDQMLVETLTEGAVHDATEPETVADAGGHMARAWTDVNGKEIWAEYRHVEGDRVVLFYENREWRVPIKRLSVADRWLLTSMNPGKLDFEMPTPRATEEDAQEAAVAPAEGDADADAADSVDADSRDASWTYDEALRRYQKKERKEKAAAAKAVAFADGSGAGDPAASPAETNLVSDKPTSSAEIFRDTLAQHHDRGGPARPSRETHGLGTMINEYECFACDKTWESVGEYHVGDQCPHCGVKFTTMTDEFDAITEEDSAGVRLRTRSIVKLIVFGVAGLAGLFGYFSRR